MMMTAMPFFLLLWACARQQGKGSRNGRPAASLKLRAWILCFERVYYSLISILSPVTQSQYNFILCLKLHGGEMSKKEKNKQGRVQRALCTAQCSVHFLLHKEGESRPGTGKQSSNTALFRNFALSFSEGRIFTCTLTEATTSPAAQCETAGRSTQRYLLCEIWNPNSFSRLMNTIFHQMTVAPCSLLPVV